MSHSKKCTVCGSTDFIPGVKVLDQGQYSDFHLKLGIAQYPEAFFFKGWVMGQITADICASCGHLELFIDNPAELKEAYQKLQNSQ